MSNRQYDSKLYDRIHSNFFGNDTQKMILIEEMLPLNFNEYVSEFTIFAQNEIK